MALANLRKQSPSVERSEVSLEAFIEGADRYAMGLADVLAFPKPAPQMEKKDCKLKRATFTLGDTAIAQLTALSERTGIAKSRLIRIWLSQVSETMNISAMVDSDIS